ncbi:MAG: hypothetical protein JWM95_3619 [Gemmatimonadetes bacterium]|nr:hypothetical protein [Gemmatimonadota bacterium]
MRRLQKSLATVTIGLIGATALGCRARDGGARIYAFVSKLEAQGDSAAITVPLRATLGVNGHFFVSSRGGRRVLVLDAQARPIGLLDASFDTGYPGTPSYVLPRGDSLIVGDYDGQSAMYSLEGQRVHALNYNSVVGGDVVLARGDTLFDPSDRRIAPLTGTTPTNGDVCSPR